jgi:hypothetical protein
MASWKKLAEANRHWRDGMSRVAEQQARVEEIERRGEDATRSRELLAILEQVVLATGLVRRRLLQEVRQATPEMTNGEPQRPPLRFPKSHRLD